MSDKSFKVSKTLVLKPNTLVSTPENGEIQYDSSAGKFKFRENGSWTEIVGAEFPIDTILQLKGTETIGTWSTGNNASFLGGGTLAGTFAYETTTPIHGISSYKYTQAAGSLNDYLASPAYPVDLRFRGQQAFLTFPYKYNGLNSEVKIVVYDASNSTVISSQLDLLSASSNIQTAIVPVVIPLACTNIRVGFQIVTLNSGKVLEFDNLELSLNSFNSSSNITTAFTKMEGSSARGATDTIVVKFDTTAISSGTGIEVTNTTANGTYFRITAPGSLTVNSTLLPAANGAVCHITKNQVTLTALSTTASEIQAAVQDYTSTGTVNLKATFDVVAGDIIRVTANATSAADPRNNVQLTLLKTDSAVIVPNDQISSDTMLFSFKSTAIVDSDPIGTFNTYTYAANTNTATISGSAPTQSTSDMNINGIQVFARAFNAASTTSQPTRFDIKIGKGLKSKEVELYLASAKTTEASYDYAIQGTTTETGTFVKYSEKTGILTINAGVARLATNTARFVDGDNINFSASGYFVFNASKAASVSSLPVLVPKIAVLSHVTSAGVAGGGTSTNTNNTRTLNTISDPYSITSLSSNQFTLQPGMYHIEAHSTCFQIDNTYIRIRNITDTTTAIMGTSEVASAADNSTASPSLSGYVTITSAKTFELQHYSATAKATNGLGVSNGTGETNTYATVTITKIR